MPDKASANQRKPNLEFRSGFEQSLSHNADALTDSTLASYMGNGGNLETEIDSIANRSDRNAVITNALSYINYQLDGINNASITAAKSMLYENKNFTSKEIIPIVKKANESMAEFAKILHTFDSHNLLMKVIYKRRLNNLAQKLGRDNINKYYESADSDKSLIVSPKPAIPEGTSTVSPKAAIPEGTSTVSPKPAIPEGFQIRLPKAAKPIEDFSDSPEPDKDDASVLQSSMESSEEESVWRIEDYSMLGATEEQSAPQLDAGPVATSSTTQSSSVQKDTSSSDPSLDDLDAHPGLGYYDDYEIDKGPSIGSFEAELLEKSRQWAEKRNEYYNTTFRKYYDEFDEYAEAFYALTRESAQKPNMIPKRVFEYAGSYNNSDLPNKLQEAIVSGNPINYSNPDYQDSYISRISSRTENSDVSNYIQDSPLIVHKAIAMAANNAFGIIGANRVLMVETKDETGNSFYTAHIAAKTFIDGRDVSGDLDKILSPEQIRHIQATQKGDDVVVDESDLEGDSTMSRKSTTDSEEKPEEASGSPSTRFQAANLAIDERSINGSYIYSAKSAEIRQVHVKSRRFRGTYTRNAIRIGNVTVYDYQFADKSKVKESQKEMAEEEELRSAIRRSAFFYHINSRTIQHYAAYQYPSIVANSFANDASIRLNGQKVDWDADSDDDGSITTITQVSDSAQDKAGSTTITQASDDISLKSWYAQLDHTEKLIVYTMSELNADTDTLSNDTIYQKLTRISSIQFNPESALELCKALLSVDNPVYWDFAKYIVSEYFINDDIGGQSKRLNARLQLLPSHGQLMRIGLLDELELDRSFSLFRGPGTIMPDSWQVRKDNVMAKRGGFKTQFQQLSVDGTLFSQTVSVLGIVGGSISAYSKEVIKQIDSLKFLFAPFPQINIAITDSLDNISSILKSSNDALLIITSILQSADVLKRIIFYIEKKSPKEIKKYSGKEKKLFFYDVAHFSYNMAKSLYDLFVAIICSNPTINLSIAGAALDLFKYLLDFIQDIINIVGEGSAIKRANISLESIETALSRSSSPIPDDEDAMPINSARENSQAQFFFSLAKANHKKKIRTSAFSIASTTINTAGVGTALGLTGTNSQLIRVPFRIAAKGVEFIGALVNKGMEYNLLEDTMQTALGDKKYLYYPNFNRILKRETGITNHHYLNDVTKIFMAIDMHHLVSNSDTQTRSSDARLAIDAAAPYFRVAGYDDDDTLNQLKLIPFDKYLKAIGAPSDWRNVLKNSVYER